MNPKNGRKMYTMRYVLHEICISLSRKTSNVCLPFLTFFLHSLQIAGSPTSMHTLHSVQATPPGMSQQKVSETKLNLYSSSISSIFSLEVD